VILHVLEYVGIGVVVVGIAIVAIMILRKRSANSQPDEISI
jgi:hypothetical protein